VNLRTNPAIKGSVVSLMATGSGLWEIDLPDGVPALVPLPKPRLPVAVVIGGQVAEVVFVGAAPGQVGLLQINFRVPARVTSGNMAVVLRVGEVTSAVGPLLSIF